MLNSHTDLRSRLHRAHRRAKIVLSNVGLQLIKRPVVFLWRHCQPMAYKPSDDLKTPSKEQEEE